jgi:hypothetical protein
MDQFEAAREVDLEQLRSVLTAHSVDIRLGDDGWTPLHWAAINGYAGCVNLCLEMQAYVNARSNTGSTSLHLASKRGHVEVVRVLLDAGAIVDAADVYGWTPLYCAIIYNRIDIARLLIDRGGKVSNVKLDRNVRAIPNWITTFITSRSRCRFAATIIIGIHKYHRTIITGNNDINVLRLIGKHVWSTRMNDVWSRKLATFNNCVSF